MPVLKPARCQSHYFETYRCAASLQNEAFLFARARGNGVGRQPQFVNALRMGDFKKLQVWRKAHALSLNVYRVVRRIRGAEHVSLRSQAIRAAMSIPTNIVDGNGYRSPRDFKRFLGYAVDSATELEYHLIFAHDIGAISKSDFRSLVDQLTEVRKMIHGLMDYLSGLEGSD